MSETEETCHVTEEVITTEVIVDAGCSTGEIVVADMDNDFVAEEVFAIHLPLFSRIITTYSFKGRCRGRIWRASHQHGPRGFSHHGPQWAQRKRELGVFRRFQHRGGERRGGSLGRWQ